MTQLTLFEAVPAAAAALEADLLATAAKHAANAPTWEKYRRWALEMATPAQQEFLLADVARWQRERGPAAYWRDAYEWLCWLEQHARALADQAAAAPAGKAGAA